MVPALLKCKLRELWRETQYWSWFTSEHEVKMVHISALQSSTAYKEVAPMASVHCEKWKPFYSVAQIWRGVLFTTQKWFQRPISLDSAQPAPKAALCPVTRLPQQWWPVHSTQHSLLPGSRCTAGGLVARIAAPLRESPEPHETHRSSVLHRKVLPVHSTFGACPLSNIHGMTEAGGTTETLGKK